MLRQITNLQKADGSGKGDGILPTEKKNTIKSKAASKTELHKI